MTLNLRINQFVCFAICLLLMLVIPITRDHRIFGFDIKSGDDDKVETVRTTPDGEIVVNTTDIGKDIIGYGGTTPVEITIKDGHILKVVTLPNQETPEFYGAVRNSDLLESLDGLTLEEAANAPLDGVSGATYSSNAIIKNIRLGVNYALDESHLPPKEANGAGELDFRWYATLFIILCGAVIPLFLKNMKYRYLQLILNVAILGFWGGTFISYSIMVSALSNGITRIVLIPVALMLVTAFIYPMFGKVNHYCTWLCPYGSLQELVGKCCPVKIKISQLVAKWLSTGRQVLWFGLMWLLWTGLWFDWMGYEPFAAFFFHDASWVTLGIAIGFVVLSLFVQRPYCRFVCPTGSLFKFSEGRN